MTGVRRVARARLACLLGIVLLGALLRGYHLEDWPAFVDEDMYTTVAVEMTHLAWPEFVLHSTDAPSTGIAKTPLVFIAQAGLVSSGLDPLVAGRAISAASGVIAIPLTFWLGRRLGGTPTIGLLTAALYALLPLAVLHERMVLQDGPMTTAALAAVLVADHAMTRRSVRYCVLAAALGALAVQVKVSAVFAALLVTRIAFTEWQANPWRVRAAALLMPAGPAIAYLTLMLAPTGPGLAAQNAILSGATPSLMRANVEVLADTLGTYFPFGLWLLIPFGYVVLARKKSASGVLVLWALLVFIVPWLVLSRGSPSRYYLPAMPYLCGLVALALATIGGALGATVGRWDALGGVGRWRTTVGAFPAAGALVILLSVSARFALDRGNAVLSTQDAWGYRSGWPSGYMYAAAKRFLAATAGSEARVAYVVDDQHRIAMGLYRRDRNGVAVALPLLLDSRILPALTAADYVVVDDTRYDQPGERLAELRVLAPDLDEVGQFTNPGSQLAVTVLAPSSSAISRSAPDLVALHTEQPE